MLKISVKHFFVFVIFLVIAWFFWQNKKNPEVYILQRGTVDTGIVRKTIEVDGTIVPGRRAEMTAELPVMIKSVRVKVNDRVQKGDILLELDGSDLQARLKQAQLEVKQAELAEKLARRHWDELKPETRESIKSKTREAKEKEREIRAQLDKAVLTAPFDGLIVKQEARVGEVAQGLLLRLIDPESLRLEAEVPEVDLGKVKIGAPVFVRLDAYPEQIISGQVTDLERRAFLKGENTYFKAIVNLIAEDLSEKLFDGLNAESKIEISHREGVKRVNRDLVAKDEQGYFVYLAPILTVSRDYFNSDNPNNIQQIESIKSTELKKKYFQAGLVGDEYVEIKSGLAVGDQVVKISEKNPNQKKDF